MDEIEGKVKEFRAKKFDLGRQLKAIEAFESQAVDSAMETKRRVDEQVVELEAALKDIRATRAVEDLTVVSCACFFFSCFLLFGDGCGLWGFGDGKG